MKGVGVGTRCTAAAKGTGLPSQLPASALISGPGEQMSCQRGSHPEPPSPWGPAAGARLRAACQAVGSSGRWPGRAFKSRRQVPCRGWGWSVQGALRSGWGVGDLGLLKGQQVVEMKGQLALQDSSPPPASAPKWTQCQVDEGIKSWPQPKRPRFPFHMKMLSNHVLPLGLRLSQTSEDSGEHVGAWGPFSGWPGSRCALKQPLILLGATERLCKRFSGFPKASGLCGACPGLTCSRSKPFRHLSQGWRP